jgi:hypothetical protein
MPTAAPQTARALNLLKKRGMLRLKGFIAEGIGPETLARLVRNEAVVRPASGLYQLPEPPRHAAHTLAEAAVLIPKGVILPHFGSSVSRVNSPGAVCRLDGDRAHCLATDNRISANPDSSAFRVQR